MITARPTVTATIFMGIFDSGPNSMQPNDHQIIFASNSTNLDQFNPTANNWFQNYSNSVEVLRESFVSGRVLVKWSKSPVINLHSKESPRCVIFLAKLLFLIQFCFVCACVCVYVGFMARSTEVVCLVKVGDQPDDSQLNGIHLLHHRASQVHPLALSARKVIQVERLVRIEMGRTTQYGFECDTRKLAWNKSLDQCEIMIHWNWITSHLT